MSGKQNGEMKIADLSMSGDKKNPPAEGDREGGSQFKIVGKAEESDRPDSPSELVEEAGKEKSEDKKDSLLSSGTHTSGTHTGASGKFLEGFETVVMDSPLYKPGHTRYVQLMSSYLLCLLGPEELVGSYWVIENNKEISIGRNRKCDISIQDLSISKKHLNIRSNQDNFFIEDKQSTNGTFVNGKQIEKNKSFKISDNSKIKIGNIVFKLLVKGNPEIISMIENFAKMLRDSLTGVGNKSMLNKRAGELFIQSRQRNTPLSLIIFDIDHFKKVNDTYGHLAGDFILKEVVKSVKSHFRSYDVFVRCGGEEFCIIMQSLIDRAERAIDNARKKLETQVFQYKEHNIKVTISGGVACQKQTDRKWKDIYERADKLLYKAKATGRNKVFAAL